MIKYQSNIADIRKEYSMGLFKKECSICGGDAGLIKSKKVSDGVICGDCVAKASPLFEDYKDATVQDIKNQIDYREGPNKELLAAFNPDKFLGVKKHVARLCIIDEAARKFAIEYGPEELFRDNNPDIIDFDQVEDVYLEVNEDWSNTDQQYAAGKGTMDRLTQDKYDEVFWRYDFYLHIVLKNHPYLNHIRYKMNAKTTIIQVPQRMFMFKRGLEMNGEYHGKDIKALAEKLGEKLGSEDKAIERGYKLDVLTLKDKDKSFGDRLGDSLKERFDDTVYLKKIENCQNHVKRANRIRRILLGKGGGAQAAE